MFIKLHMIWLTISEIVVTVVFVYGQALLKGLERSEEQEGDADLSDAVAAQVTSKSIMLMMHLIFFGSMIWIIALVFTN